MSSVLKKKFPIRRKTGGSDGPPRGGGKHKMGPLFTPYPFYGGNHPTSAPLPPQSGIYGGGAGGSFGGTGGNF